MKQVAKAITMLVSVAFYQLFQLALAESESGEADMLALSQVMHGAAGQQPEDAPKDKYGDPYIIGDLGGVPVNLPSSVVNFVEYDDSPGWDIDKIQNYHPPVRSYDSKLEAFGFEMRISDGALYDTKNPELNADRKSAKSWDRWVEAGISSGELFASNSDWINDMFEYSFDPEEAKNSFGYYSRKLPETQFGLDVYVNDNVNPRTGVSFREEHGSEDLFIRRNEENDVITYITCSNNDVPSPPCIHYFYFPEPMKLNIELHYSRHALSEWQKIEQHVIEAVTNFSAQP